MINQIYVYFSVFNCPYKNLALENELLKRIKHNEKILLFYRNRPSIVLGRFQNPWKECNIEEVVKNDIALVRRQSGGGTVYHDLDNLNYCFIDGSKDYDKGYNHSVIIRALKELGIESYSSKRSDLLLSYRGAEFKFSGSAFKQKKDRSFHHGTLLLNSKLDVLNQILRSPQDVVNSKSIDSVRSRVINLAIINPEIQYEQIIEEIKNKICDDLNLEASVEVISIYDQEFYRKMKSLDWIFNQTPFFEIEVENDGNRVEFALKKGKIEGLTFQIPSFNSILIGMIEDFFIGRNLIDTELNKLMVELRAEFELTTAQLTALLSLLEKSLLFVASSILID